MKDLKLSLSTDKNVNISFGKSKHIVDTGLPVSSTRNLIEIGIYKPVGVTMSSTEINTVLNASYRFLAGESASYSTSNFEDLMEYHLTREESVNEVIKLNVD